MTKVTIQNVQAIKYVSFDMPDDDGGVVLLRGRMGAGKTTVLACLNALLGRKVSLSPAEGALHGTIEGMGVSIKVDKRQSAKGETAVPNLEGRFDFSELVEPAIKDPVARNKSRIRALVGLTGGEGKPDDFYELFGGEDAFWSVVDRKVMPRTTDILDLADFVKGQTEAAARVQEARHDSDAAAWQVAVVDSKGHSPDKEPPAVQELANAYSSAQRERLAAEETLRNVEAAKARNAAAEAKLSELKANPPARTAEQANGIVQSAKQMVAELEAKLATAKKTLEEAKRLFQDAVTYEERICELEDQIEELPASLPEVEPLKAAEQKAYEQLAGAEETKRCYDAAVRAKGLVASVQSAKAEAERLRAIAAKCSEVVTKKLPEGCPLQVRDVTEGKTTKSLLCAYHERRKSWIPVDELSTGEKWEVILPIAIEAVGTGGIIPANQEAWQALDPEGRAWVALKCREAKVWLISGEVTDGEIRAEKFGAGK